MDFRNNVFIPIFIILSFQIGISQDIFRFSEKLSWEEVDFVNFDQTTKKWTIPNGFYIENSNKIPNFSKRIKIPYNAASATINILPKTFKILDNVDPSETFAKGRISPYYQIVKEREHYYLELNFKPLIYENGQYKAIEKFDLEISLSERKPNIFKNNGNKDESILANGSIYKFAIAEDGLYKIDFGYLRDSLGISMTGINPRKIQILGNKGGALPERIADQRIDDLEELAISIIGEEDGSFDQGDQIQFYAYGPHEMVFDDENLHFDFNTNVYDDYNYYFLRIGDEDGLRIKTSPAPNIIQNTTSKSQKLLRHEIDNLNLLGQYVSTQGSGQQWFGEIFSNQRNQEFGSFFDLTDIDLSQEINIKCQFAGRNSSPSTVVLDVNGQKFSKTISSSNLGDVGSTYARSAFFDENLTIDKVNPKISLAYQPSGSNAEAWLDYIQLNAVFNNMYRDKATYFQDITSRNFDGNQIIFKGSSADIRVWNITGNNVSEVLITTAADNKSFSYYSDNVIQRFVAFRNTDITKSPKKVGKLENQNLHSLDDLDMVIITHPSFLEAAQKIQAHRQKINGFNVALVTTDQIFNEFSSGKQDPTAIRDFAKMLYDRSGKFKYLLLIGDGSYDYRDRNTDTEFQSFVPAYETKESLSPLVAFPSDDYFALLDDNEGGTLRGALDIAVGRLPVKTPEEADNVVDKIIGYESDPSHLGDWRLKIGFTADDEDSNKHLIDTDRLATNLQKKHGLYNQEKIYFDAFQQVSTPGGARYPDANAKINNEIFKGLLVLNYLGHGGPKGWSQERVLQIEDINEWDNAKKLPLIVTATCQFTGFDDPALVTAGEEAILNPKGGAVGLFSTVRAVYASDNYRLAQAVFDTLFTLVDDRPMPIGEALRRAKNSNSADTININARKFYLIGDPALTLSTPKYKAVTTKINGKSISTALDTIRALQRVKIEGQITDNAGKKIETFNGLINPTIYDKRTEIETLSNDSDSPKKKFEVQRNIIYKGSASVTNGEFTFEFVVPKDINYTLGKGKISYYATNSNDEDAAGFYTDIVIGETDATVLEDKIGPKVDLFLNDTNFAFGGISNQKPILLANLSDENGINFTGSSIGHDISLTIDANTQNTIILNDFYSSDVDNFSAGTVRFPLEKLEIGQHSLTVRAFDVANNPGEGYLEFTVADSESKVLEHVFNFPNPFTTNTNFTFEHGLPNTNLEISIDIYTLSGKVVKQLRTQVYSTGFRDNSLSWNGKDDFENQLARGIYLYKIKINASELNISKESSFEKLVLLK